MNMNILHSKIVTRQMHADFKSTILRKFSE
jgi:hypothetical protein